MPPSANPTAPSSHNDIRKRPSRVVPAIPLPLSKPRQGRERQTPETEQQEARPKSPAAAQEEVALERPATQPRTEANDNDTERTSAQAADVAVKKSVEATESHPKIAQKPSSRSSGSQLGNGDSVASIASSSAQAGPFASGPTHARKPSSIFEMRGIRTELPPAFVPQAGQHTPKSAMSPHSDVHFPSNAHAQASRHDGNTPAFGNGDSGLSTPAPTDSSAFVPHHVTMGAPQPLQFPQNHANRTSEFNANPAYHHPAHRHNMPVDSRSGYGPTPQPLTHAHPHVPRTSRYPQQDSIISVQSQHLNGSSSRPPSVSQGSSAAMLASTDSFQPMAGTPGIYPDHGSSTKPAQFARPSFHDHPNQAPPHLHRGAPQHLPHLANGHGSLGFENADGLRNHVQSHFADPSLADCHVQITEYHAGGSSSHLAAHKLILSRSHTLFSMIRNSGPPSPDSSKTEMLIRLDRPYIRLGTFMEAVKFLYGGMLSQLDRCRAHASASEAAGSHAEAMDIALQHVAMGAWLGLPVIAGRGVATAGVLLDWENIAAVLGFALDGGLSHVWVVDDGSEDRSSTTSSDDSLGRPDGAGIPVHDPYSTHLLQRIVDFTVHVFPPDFYLDPAAPQLTSSPRLPGPHPGRSSRSSRSNPRLSQIRFGEVPPEEHQLPSTTTTTISSLLLTLPFPLLKCILEHVHLATRLGAETTASVMRQVIAEREARRASVLKSHSAGQLLEQVSDSQAISNLFWEEYVEGSMQHRAGFRLGRRRRGPDTPPSSGAVSEGNR